MAGLSAQSVFITGANRGLGLEFVKQFLRLSHPPKHIFATCRNPDSAKELNELAASHQSIHIHRFDAVDYNAYPGIVQWVEQTVKDEGLNILLNNAGQFTSGSDLASITREKMINDFDLNAVVPLMLSKAFLPLLKSAADSSDLSGLTCSRAAIINMTSKMGSIDDNGSGGFYAYRASKAAQNMITKSLSNDLKAAGVLVLALHPGWVLTEMGGKNALINTETSVSSILKVLGELKTHDTGKFISYEGSVIPW